MTSNHPNSVNPLLALKNLITIVNDISVPSSSTQQILKLLKQPTCPINWSPEMIIVVLCEQVQVIQNSKRLDNRFKIDVWDSSMVAVHINSSNGALLTGKKYQEKLERLKKKQKIQIRLKAVSGFGFDPILSAVTVPDEIWDTESSKQPAIQEFRN